MDLSWQKNRSTHVEYYTRSVETYGYSHKAVGWGSPESQRVRFRVLTEIGLTSKASILDVGCGLGDLFGYLTERFNVRPDYVGVDLTPAMIRGARARYPDGSFTVGDILDPGIGSHQADFVVASGIFALLDLDRNPHWIMRDLVAGMFRLCRIGVAFNSLSSWTPYPEQGKFFVDPLAAVAMCREISPWVAVRHDYLYHDFTIYLYRDQERRMP